MRFHSSPLFNHEYNEYDNYNDQQLHSFLINISKEDMYCVNCIQYHLGRETLQSFIEKESIEMKLSSDIKSYWIYIYNFADDSYMCNLRS